MEKSAGSRRPASSASTLQVIERRSLRKIAAERIRAAIERGDLKAGARLTELGLARQLGVGQATIREALVELEHQGFVEHHGPRQTSITALTRKQIDDIYAVRRRLEALAVDLLVADRFANLTRADEECERMVQAAQTEDHQEFYRADLDFHRALWRATGNDSLFDSLERLTPKLFAFVVIRHARLTPQRLAETAAAHRKLVELIRARKLKPAKEAMEKIMEGGWLDDIALPE